MRKYVSAASRGIVRVGTTTCLTEEATPSNLLVALVAEALVPAEWGVSGAREVAAAAAAAAAEEEDGEEEEEEE